MRLTLSPQSLPSKMPSSARKGWVWLLTQTNPSLLVPHSLTLPFWFGVFLLGAVFLLNHPAAVTCSLFVLLEILGGGGLVRFGRTCHSNLPPVDRVGKARIRELCCFVSVCSVEAPCAED